MEQQVAQLRAELRKVRDERDRTHRVLEVTEWKALASANDRTTIETLEAELAASRESENWMLDSLTLQTKQMELTKISPEEARLEITTLQETVQRLEAARTPVTTTTPRSRHDRDLQRVAPVADEKSKKAMEELVMALKEVNAELHATRQQVARAQHEAETARMEADRMHVSAKRRDDKLRAVSDELVQLRAEAEESFTAWRGKEAGLTACVRALEAELAEARGENARLLESQHSGRAEVAKLKGHPKAGCQGHQGGEGGAGRPAIGNGSLSSSISAAWPPSISLCNSSLSPYPTQIVVPWRDERRATARRLEPVGLSSGAWRGGRTTEAIERERRPKQPGC
jgi:hypothetical protein